MIFVNEKSIKKKYHYTKKYNKLKENINQSVYDPRVKFNVISNNPALILANIVKDHIESDEDFWQKIAVLADYCDQKA